MRPDDAAVVEGFLRGDPEAVATVDGWIARAAWPFQRRLGHRWDDVLQDVRVEVIRLFQRQEFRGGSSLKTYLWRVVNHACLEQIRSQSRWQWAEPETLDTEALDTDEGPPLDSRRPLARGAHGIDQTSGHYKDDEESFRVLFQRYHRVVFYFFRRRGFPEQDCQDLTQETFLRVYHGLSQFRGEARLESWLFQIAKNVWHNEVRRRSRIKRTGVRVSLDEAIQPDESPGKAGLEAGGDEPIESPPVPLHETEWIDEVLAQERTQLLYKALLELPPQMRRCLTLRIGQGLKYSEIATMMGISIDTVKSHLFQAKKQLSAKLATHFPDLTVE